MAKSGWGEFSKQHCYISSVAGCYTSIPKVTIRLMENHSFVYIPNRDFYTRLPVEVFVSIAHNQYYASENASKRSIRNESGTCNAAEPSECNAVYTESSHAAEVASTGEIILYYSVIEVVEDVDEVRAQ